MVPMRPLGEIRTDILALEKKIEGCLAQILGASNYRESRS